VVTNQNVEVEVMRAARSLAAFDRLEPRVAGYWILSNTGASIQRSSSR
jgi:hypothetical protein